MPWSVVAWGVLARTVPGTSGCSPTTSLFQASKTPLICACRPEMPLSRSFSSALLALLAPSKSAFAPVLMRTSVASGPSASAGVALWTRNPAACQGGASRAACSSVLKTIWSGSGSHAWALADP